MKTAWNTGLCFWKLLMEHGLYLPHAFAQGTLLLFQIDENISFCEHSECFFLKVRIGFWQSSLLVLLNTVRFRSEILSPAPDTWPLWIYATYFHFFFHSSRCNHSGKPEQPQPYQHCPPCWLLPDRSHSRHHHSCPGCAFPAGAVHHLQAEAEREGDTHAHGDLHPCYEGHQCRLHHFR